MVGHMKRQKLKYITTILLLLGALLWNSWILGWLNHGVAGYLHMSISELEALHQPYANLFNFFEYASGTCLIIGAIGMILIIKKPTLLSAVAVGIGLIGCLTLYDVQHPLDCNEYQNPACVMRVNANQVSQTDKQHNEESRITAYVTAITAFLVALWSYYGGHSRFLLAASIFALAGIIITLEILNYSDAVLPDAIAERVWNVLVSLDVVLATQGLAIIKKHKS